MAQFEEKMGTLEQERQQRIQVAGDIKQMMLVDFINIFLSVLSDDAC